MNWKTDSSGNIGCDTNQYHYGIGVHKSKTSETYRAVVWPLNAFVWPLNYPNLSAMSYITHDCTTGPVMLSANNEPNNIDYSSIEDAKNICERYNKLLVLQ